MIKHLKGLEINSIYDFDNAFSINELLCKFWGKIEEVINISNESIDILNWVKEQGLSDEIINLLSAWIDDGTFSTIINEHLFNELNEKIDTIGTTTENITNELNEKIDTIGTTTENITNELNEKIDTNKLEISSNLNKINTINNNLSNYMLKSDLITETGSITLGENIKIATDLDGKQLFTLEKNKEGIIIGNITVSTVNGANDISHGKILFTLNENYRPSHQIIIPCYCSRISQPDKIIGAISIYKDGRALINLFEKSSEEEIYPVESVYINFFIKVS